MNSQSPPNIVLCVMDDHQHDALGAAGHPVARTPFLDRLAERGVRYTAARMPGGSAAAVCMPSRAMLHSGRSHFGIERDGAVIPPEHPTLGEGLRRAGYATFHTGKWHNDRTSLNRSFESVDEVFLGGMSDPWNTPLFHQDPTGAYDATLPAIPDFMASNTVEERPGDHCYPGRHGTDIFCDRAADYIRENEHGGRPFFLSLALMAPHDPRTAPPAYHERFSADAMPLPENFRAAPPCDTGALEIRDEQLAAKPRDPGEIRRHLADYHAMIEHLDDGLARIMAALEARSLAENTIFVFTSDHGLAVGQHGLMGKQCVYEHSLRVPLILAGPGIPSGAVRNDPVLHYDLFATLLRRAGMDCPDGVASRDLHPEAAHAPAPEPEPLRRNYFAYGASVRAYREDPFKLIEYAHGDYRATELFNLVEDPLETTNLADRPAYADTLRRLRANFRAAAEANGDFDHFLGQSFWQAMDA